LKGKLQHDKNDVIKVLWDKGWSESDKLENVNVDIMIMLGMADIPRCEDRRFFNPCATGSVSMRTIQRILN
jgi:hypothetical protein